MLFSGKVAVVTGAASGLGRALAVRLDNLGAILALADIDANGLEETGRLLKNSNYVLHTLDVASRGQVEQFRKVVVSTFGGVDIVINNAGVHISQRLADTTKEDFEWIMGVNFWGVVYCCQAFLPDLMRRPESAIANISSIYGIVSATGQGAYNTTKFAVRGFTEALRHELIKTPVHVMGVYPGGIRTNILRNSKFYVARNIQDSREDYIRNFDIIARTTPDAAAAVILNALSQRRPRCLVGADARILDLAQRLFPSRYWPILEATLYRFARLMIRRSRTLQISK
jgi:NAD(P)-dependent dehydrogenase (short-subunit alcohol dehydrogenase family)